MAGLPFPRRVMLLGSGELGKEVAIAAQRLGCQVIAVDRYAGAPAMAVAQVAEADAGARRLLDQAGEELARLARLLIARHGMRPVVVCGRAASLHPVIEASLRRCLPPGTACEFRTLQPHRDAAFRAAGCLG